MKKVFNILAVLFILIGIAFVILPMGTMGVLPTGLAIVFSGLAFYISEADARKFPKWLLIISALLLIIVIAKAMMPDEVAVDTEFEQKKIESKTEDLKELEELEGDLQ